MASFQTNFGSIRISDEAVALIAGRTLEQCNGIVGMAAKRAMDGLAELLNRENYAKGIKVTTQNNELVIELYAIVEYGIAIHRAAQTAIDTVKRSIEVMTGLPVRAVNITVEGIKV